MKLFIKSLIVFYLNHIITHIPCKIWRNLNYRLLGMKVGKSSHLDMNLYVLEPRKISIGNHCHINQSCFIDRRGYKYIVMFL